MIAAGREAAAAADAALLERFESGSLPSAEFRHRDHIRVAWLYLRRYPLLEAIGRFVAALKSFAARHGAARKYHETITWFYLLLVHDRIARAPAVDDWEEFARANPDLFARGLLERRYRPETLGSALARERFLMPDADAWSGPRTGAA